jgi:Cof subfamily protein (haloacid dehalogenase superfamily)
MYKLIAMDLDGTLFNSTQRISAKNLDAIESLKALHLYLVIASGRTYRDIAKMTASLKLTEYDRAYFICYNGVIAVKTNPYEVIYQKMIHSEDVRKIARLVEGTGLKMHVFCEDQIYLSKDIEYTIQSDFELMENASKIDMDGYAGRDEIYKVLILDQEDKINAFQKTIPQSILTSYTVFKSASHLLEFVHKEGSKGDALANLARHLGVQREEVMAFGDEENDISMLKFAGMGIAMENATPHVKAIATAITLSNKLDGVAEAIKKYITREG